METSHGKLFIGMVDDGKMRPIGRVRRNSMTFSTNAIELMKIKIQHVGETVRAYLVGGKAIS